MSEDYNAIIREFLAGPHAEAVAWLNASSSEPRQLAEMSPERSQSFVQHLYALGAEEIIAVGLQDDSCRYVLVRLPYRDADRAALFAFERGFAEEHGFDGAEDEGQEFLFFDAKLFE